MDKTAAKQTWNTLAGAVDEIYNRNASQLSFEELYRNAYNLVLHKHGTLLYEGVTEKINSHLTEIAERLSNVPSNSLLEELSTTWTEHEVRMEWRLCEWSCVVIPIQTWSGTAFQWIPLEHLVVVIVVPVYDCRFPIALLTCFVPSSGP